MEQNNIEKPFQEQIYDIMEVFQQNKNNPQNIETLMKCVEDLAIISTYLSAEYNKQSVNYADNRSMYYFNIGQRKAEVMKLDKINNKKVTSAYADTIADQENKEYKKAYIRAEGVRDGLKQMLYQISQNISIIKDRIIFLKSN